MTSAFKHTTPRFSAVGAVSELARKDYEHIGPGYYAAEDVNRPSLAKCVDNAYFPSMNTKEARMSQASMGCYISELDQQTRKGPRYPNIFPGCYDTAKPFVVDPKEYCGRISEKSVFLRSPNAPRIEDTRSKHQREQGAIENRFDHVKEAEEAWSHGGRLPQEERWDKETPEERGEYEAMRLTEGRKRDKKMGRRMENIHKYGVPVNQEDAIQDTEMSQHGLFNTMMRDVTKRKSAYASAFNSEVPKFNKCVFDLKTELQSDKARHIGPGHYAVAHDYNSIRYRTDCGMSTNQWNAFASKVPRFSRRPRRELTKTRNPSQLAQEIETRRRQQEHIKQLYEKKDSRGSLTSR